MQAKNSNNIPGIDVSHHQGTIDWLKVAASDIRFAFIKATEGRGYTDPQFRRNAVGAPAAGLQVGFYHYGRPEGGNTAIQEAESFLATVNGLPCRLPYVLDIEDKAANLGKDKLTEWCYEWLSEVEKRSGHPVAVYTSGYFAKTYLGAELGKWPLWIAHYGVEQPMCNDTWDRWSVFQYMNNGDVPGIVGNVDKNEMDLDYWRWLTVEKVTKFPDVPAGHWAEKAIAAVTGIMNGYPDGTFRPDKPVTRAELAAVVAKLIK